MAASRSELAIDAGVSAGVASTERFFHIDALRGIAALLVVWLHVTQFFHMRLGAQQALAGQWLADVAQNFDFGRIGVMLFFLISGYVIPDSIRLDRPAPLATFAIRRVLRIYPAYWLSIPISAYAVWWLWDMPFGATDFLVNLTLLQDLFGIRSAEGVYWTLLIELAFYVLCVVLALLHSLHDARRVAILAAVLVLAHTLCVYVAWLGAPMSLPLAFVPLHLSFMLCGALFRHRDDGAVMSTLSRRLFAALVIYDLLIFPAGASWAIGPVNNYVVCGAIALLLFIVGTHVVRLRARWIVWLGKISYSIYLFHVPVTMLSLWWLLQQSRESAWRTQHMAVYLLVCSGLTIVVAALVERWVERPGIALGRRVARAWQQRTAIVPDSA